MEDWRLARAEAERIEITDPAIVERFNVGAGPGNFQISPGGDRIPIVPAAGFVVDWPRGYAHPPKDLPVYEVSVVTTRTVRSTDIERYVIDPATNHGYVYIPGKEDAAYSDNVWMILRGVEGSWFHAWSAFEDLAHPLIAKAPKTR